MSRVADGLDAALDWGVVGGYTRVGSALRRRVDHWCELEGESLAGRVIVMSGATSGLGLEAARAFVRMGASLEILARNPAKAAAVRAELSAHRGARVGVVEVDTGDLAAVRSAAEVLLQRHEAIDVLVHNAGALDDVRHTSPEGLELTVASQVVGPFLLTGLLLPALRAAAPSRVLWVSSGGMYSEPLSVAHLEMSSEEYDGTVAYARAKRAQVTLAALWASRLSGERVFVHAMHPGWADTPGLARSLPTFRRVLGPLLRTPADGADTLVWLAADDACLREGGLFWHDRRARPVHRFASTRRSDTPEERARLWSWAERTSGFKLRRKDA